MTDIDSKLRLVLFPDDDGAFVGDVNAAMMELERNLADGHDARSGMVVLLQRLLPAYPALEIRQQDGLASFEADPRTWYVYRDGSAARR